MIFFASPRPFVGHFDVIQRNAIESWLKLAPAQVVLFGDNGRDIADEYGIIWRKVETNEAGLPLVRSMLGQMAENYPGEVLVFCNTDNIFLADLVSAVGLVERYFDWFVIIGSRTNIDLTERLDFDSDGLDILRERVKSTGKSGGTTAVDYFIYRGNPWPDLPPYAVGCDFYDHWMAKLAVEAGYPLIDGSSRIQMLHQNHPIKPDNPKAQIEANRAMGAVRFGVNRATQTIDQVAGGQGRW